MFGSCHITKMRCVIILVFLYFRNKIFLLLDDSKQPHGILFVQYFKSLSMVAFLEEKDFAVPRHRCQKLSELCLLYFVRRVFKRPCGSKMENLTTPICRYIKLNAIVLCIVSNSFKPTFGLL